jgi:hypothetical protein
MSMVCNRNERVGSLRITFADLSPIEISWDNPDDVEEFAENLKRLSLTMRD